MDPVRAPGRRRQPGWGVQPFATGVDYVVDMEMGPDGALYYLANSGWGSTASGQLRRIRYGTGAGTPPRSRT